MSEPEKQALEGSARTRRVQSGGGLRLTPGETRFGAALSLLPVLFSLPGVSSLALDWLVNVLPPDSIPPGPVPHVDRIDLEARGYLPPGYQKSLDNDRKGLAWERPTMAPPPDDIVPEQPRVSKAEEIEQRIAENGGDQQLASIGDLQKGAEGKDDEKGDNDKKKDNSGNTKPSQPAPTPPPPSENPKKSPETTTAKPPFRVDDPEVLQSRRWVSPDNSDQSNFYGPPPTHRISSDNTSGVIGAHKPRRTLVQSGMSALVEAGRTLGDTARRFGTTIKALRAVNPTLEVDRNGRVKSDSRVAIPGYGSPSQGVPEMSKAVKASVLEVVVSAQDSPESAGLTRPGPNPGKRAPQHTHEVERATLVEEMRVVLPSGEEVANYQPGDQVVVKGFRVSDKGGKLILVQVGERENSHIVAVSEGAFDLQKGEVIENPHLPLIIMRDKGERATDAGANGGGSEQVVQQVSPTPTDRVASVASDGREGFAHLVDKVMVGVSVTIPESLIGEGLTGEVLGPDGNSETVLVGKEEELTLCRQTKGPNGETLVLASRINPQTGESEIVRIDINNFNPELRASIGGVGEESAPVLKFDELVGILDPELVDYSQNSKVDLNFVPVNYAGNEWSETEKESIARIVAISGTVLREIVGGKIQASVPDAFVGSRVSVQVNVIKPEAWWNQNWWGFDNSGRFGLAIITPNNMIGETVSFEKLAESGLPHEIVHAVNPLPMVEGDRGFDFALREGVPELVNRVVSSRHTGFDISQPVFEGRNFGDWMSLSEEDRLSLTEEERYDFVAFAFIWLFGNHPSTLHSIREGWLTEFPDSTAVPFDRFVEWGEEGWNKTSSSADSQFPGGFRDFWQRMNIGEQ